ncbi:MAG: hypothetical protein Q9228_002109 [Teloschistes exilis]
MARIHANRTAVVPVRTGALRHARTNEQRKASYKVVLEEMTEKKRKLHTTLSFKTQPPTGYTFVAAGDPRLTAKCKDISRAQGLTVYIVSTSRRSSLGEQVGRVGYHFPSDVVEQSCKLLGVTVAKSGNLHLEPRLHRRLLGCNKRLPQITRSKGRQQTKARSASIESEVDQKELDSRAAYAIRDLFPKIPEAEIHKIISQAFQKVVHAWLDARAMVAPPTLDKIIEWRDEKDEPDAVEDILREVIIISDDEDEESEENSTEREGSIEIISSQEIADAVHVEPLDYSTMDGKSAYDRPFSPEDDWAPSVRFIRRLSTPPADRGTRRQTRIDRQQAHRNRVWLEAVNRRRNLIYSDANGSVLGSHEKDGLPSPLPRHDHPTPLNHSEHHFLPNPLQSRTAYVHNNFAQSSSTLDRRPSEGLLNQVSKQNLSRTKTALLLDKEGLLMMISNRTACMCGMGKILGLYVPCYQVARRRQYRKLDVHYSVQLDMMMGTVFPVTLQKRQVKDRPFLEQYTSTRTMSSPLLRTMWTSRVGKRYILDNEGLITQIGIFKMISLGLELSSSRMIQHPQS